MTHTTKGCKHRYRIADKQRYCLVLNTGVEFYDIHTGEWRESIVPKNQLTPLKGSVVITAEEACITMQQVDEVLRTKGKPESNHSEIYYTTDECSLTGDTTVSWEIKLCGF